MAQPLYPTTGMSSKCYDGYHVLFWDFDGPAKLHEVIDGFSAVFERHRIGDVTILESSPGSYHAVCVDKRTPSQARTILNEHKLQDLNHCDIGASLGRWILRITEKADKPAPKLAHHIPRPHMEPAPYGASRPHAVYLAHHYGVRLPLEQRLDMGRTLQVEHYLTCKA